MPSIESPTHYERSKGLMSANTDSFFKWIEADDAVDHCGTVESPLGYVQLVEVTDEDVSRWVNGLIDGDLHLDPTDVMDAGWYVTRTDDNGIIFAMTYGTGTMAEEGARADFAEAEHVASLWDLADDQIYGDEAEAELADEDDRPMLVCIACGEAFDDIKAAHEHGVSSPRDKTWCGDDGFQIMPASEAL